MEIETFGITLPVSDWRALFTLAHGVDRAPSDYSRTLIRQEAAKAGLLPLAADKPDPSAPSGEPPALPALAETWPSGEAVKESGDAPAPVPSDTAAEVAHV